MKPGAVPFILLLVYPFIAAVLAISVTLSMNWVFGRLRATGFLLELPTAIRKRLAGKATAR